MNFSLVCVSKDWDCEGDWQEDQKRQGRISGNWVQDHIGTLETAIQTAKRTEETNGNKIDIAVVASVGLWRYSGELIFNYQRLDQRRI